MLFIFSLEVAKEGGTAPIQETLI